MVNALVSRSSGPGSSPGLGHCVVLLGKTLDCRIASLYPGVEGGVEILLVTSCYRNRDKLQSDRSLTIQTKYVH